VNVPESRLEAQNILADRLKPEVSGFYDPSVDRTDRYLEDAVSANLPERVSHIRRSPSRGIARDGEAFKQWILLLIPSLMARPAALIRTIERDAQQIVHVPLETSRTDEYIGYRCKVGCVSIQSGDDMQVAALLLVETMHRIVSTPLIAPERNQTGSA